MKRYLYIFVLAAVSAACSSEIDTYHGDAGVYFAMREKVNTVNVDTLYRESSSLPFIVTESQDSTFLLRVKILGAVSDEDRHVSVRVLEDLSNVTASDYEPLQASYVLKAGDVYGIIPVHFHRTASLEGQERRLVVELVENEDFTLPIRRWRNSSTEYVDVTRHTVVISDKYVQLPGYRVGYFGPFSEKKMKLILELGNMRLNDFNAELPIPLAKSLGQKLDRYLAQMAARGETVYEEDGKTPMTAGNNIY